MPPKAGPRPGARKGHPSLTIAQLKQSMQLRQQEEERLKKEAEEKEARLREEERLAKEQFKFEEEQRARERERRKEEMRLLRKDKASSNQGVLDRMRAAGFILPDVDRIRKEEADEKLKEVKAPKKPKPQLQDMIKLNAAAHPPSEDSEDEISEGERTVPTDSDDELSEDDWEAMEDRDERRTKRHLNNERIRSERLTRRAALEKERQAKRDQNHVLENVINLRSPICCVLGHVDTGKTSLLDRIRSTNVQGGEAGGITQQIGATFFPREALVAATKDLNERYNYKLNVPGILVIDTPGHESFTNLRNRGSSLCDIAIVVIDLMHGLEQQTRESFRLLREKKCPFIVVVNKVDRLYGWVANPNEDIQQTLEKQPRNVRIEFETRVGEVKTQLAMEGFNSELYYKNTDFRKTVSIVPTSAHTGEGISDLILLEIELVQQFMEAKMTYKDDLQCTVLEVKPITGYGFTIDVILINGELHEGDQICLCGQNQPIFSQIRSLLTPQPMREMRVKAEYTHRKMVKAAMGVKIAANDLEYVVPGTPLLVYHHEDEKEKVAELVMTDSTTIRSQLNEDGIGVTVQSSTLGGLEALLSFLKDMKIQVGHAAIGPIHKRHLIQVLSMKRQEPRFAVVLAFDVVVSDEAREVAAKNEITIFEANVIYHLFDKFTEYIEGYEAREKDRLRNIAVFPVRLKIIDNAIHATDPIILPVLVERGQLRVGTPLCALIGENVVPIGKVMSIEREKKTVPIGKPGMELSVKINTGDSGVTFSRQFNKDHVIVSKITRPSVDAVKKFKDELTEDDVILLATLIKVFKVPK
ncbi:unnamed protein product [Phytomonas sp. Hart1]|nr:unnamed protein product [Phytomonas sp. Hart1]|eukprot:CCW69335.1 unnamed protein product [Phytomonas sp. isolate Hart1]